MDKTTEKTFRRLAKKTMKNRPEVLRLMNDYEFNREFIQQGRDYIAQRIREARNKLKNQ